MQFSFPLPSVRKRLTVAKNALDAKNALPIEVVICTRNRSSQLRAALASLLQTRPLPERILLIDGSGEFDASVLDFYRTHKKRPELRYFLIEHQGIAQSRNFALQTVKSPYFSFLDDDERTPKKYLQRIDELLIQRNFDVLMGHVRPAHLHNYWNQVWGVSWPKLPAFDAGSEKFIISACISAYRTKLLRDNAIFFSPTMQLGGEEEEFSERVQQHTQKISYNPKLYVYHDFRTTMLGFGKQFFTYGKTACLRFFEIRKSKHEDLLGYMRFQQDRIGGTKWNVGRRFIPGLLFKNIAYWSGFLSTFIHKSVYRN